MNSSVLPMDFRNFSEGTFGVKPDTAFTSLLLLHGRFMQSLYGET